MKKMFGKSKKEDDDDANRSALFGSRSKASGPPPANVSPYANNDYSASAPTNASYSSQSTFNSQNTGYSSQSSYGGGNAAYGAGGGGGYGAPKEPMSYGEPTTYGGVPEPKAYGVPPNGGAYAQRAPLGRNDSTSTYDSNRDALFGGRQQQQQQMMARPPPQDTYAGAEPTGAGAYAQSGGYSLQQQSYGAPRQYNSHADPYTTHTGDSERQLTAEEEEEEDVDALKQQIRFTKQASLASTANALRAAQAAEETGRNTLLRLGEQGEKLHNTEVNLNLAKNHGRIAEAKAKELKTLNRSMFAVHVANPFNSQTRAQEREQEILQQQQIDRDEREAARSGAFQSRQRLGGALQGAQGAQKPRQKMSLAEKAKYQYEADEEDDQIEDQIDENLGQLGDMAGRLKTLALATSREVDEQNERITRLTRTTEVVDDHIALNTQRLKRFGA